MLKELTRADWLSILSLPERRVPLVLLVRGTRSLTHWYRAAQPHFTNVLELGTPNGILDDVFVADLGPHPVAYASVYGAPMASEVTHVFGLLGTRLVIQIGNCGALADDLATGDLFSASEACCGDGASARASINDELELAQPPSERLDNSAALTASAVTCPLTYAMPMHACSASIAGQL